MNEVEIRGVLDQAKAENLKDFLDKNAKFEKTFKRLSVDISPGFDPKTRLWNQHNINLRIKKSDQEEKISLKYGDSFSDTVAEHEVIINQGQLLEALKIFEVLGFGSGMIYFWESWVYEYLNCEVKLSKYSEDKYMWEIEARGNIPDNEAREVVYGLAKELDLVALTADEYKAEALDQVQNFFEIYSSENLHKYLENHFN
jgi:hypothetical protein